MSNEIVSVEPMEIVPIEHVVRRIAHVNEVLKKTMKKGIEYDTIPGCGPKPTLLQPGAEMLCLTFNMAPKYEVTERDMPAGHREYTVRCDLFNAAGRLVGSGIGVRSTMETKYKYRSDIIGPVPKAYWEKRDESLLGPEGCEKKKINGQWLVVRRVEHGNPADFYNTVAKMAAKCAFTSAVRGACGASGMFAVDLEDLRANGLLPTEGEDAPVDAEFQESEPPPPPNPNDDMRPLDDTLPPAPAPKPAPRAQSGGVPTIPYGTHKGKRLDDESVPTDALEKMQASVQRALKDPDKAKWKANNQTMLQGIMDELDRRAGMK